MGIRSLEAKILEELKQVTGNNKLRQKDIMEWSTGTIEAQAGEQTYRLPTLGINVAVKVNQPTK